MAKISDQQFTQISRSMNIIGDFSGESDIRIAGKIKGNLVTSGDIVIENTGFLEGTIKTRNATVAGKINGDIECNEKLILEAKSLFVGNIKTKQLIIECGAKFKGNCEMPVDNSETKKP
ncbi:MAG: polymer-forming cytoskeletal protein [Fibrobacteraceae bacterium]|nr:polymer-forming cytoskeletal protein [Fibrobacteraceae bacterium]